MDVTTKVKPSQECHACTHGDRGRHVARVDRSRERMIGTCVARGTCVRPTAAISESRSPPSEPPYRHHRHRHRHHQHQGRLHLHLGWAAISIRASRLIIPSTTPGAWQNGHGRGHLVSGQRSDGWRVIPINCLHRIRPSSSAHCHHRLPLCPFSR